MAERNVKLSLPEEDADRLWETGARAGMTPDQVLRHFVADLTGGASLDRDNQENARDWFNHYAFLYKNETRRFSVWAAQNGELYGNSGALFYVGELDDVTADLADLVDSPAYARDTDLVRDAMDLREAIADYRRSLKGLYDKYTKDLARRNAWIHENLTAQTFEEALDDLREHKRQREAFKRGEAPNSGGTAEAVA